MFELVLDFLSSPWNLWASRQIHLRKAVLRLAFSESMAYQHGEGSRTLKTTLLFSMLVGFREGCKMARPEGFEPPTPWFVVTRSAFLSLSFLYDISLLNSSLWDGVVLSFTLCYQPFLPFLVTYW